MGNAAAIVATLDMTRGKFVTEIEKTEKDLGELKTSAADTAAAIVLTDRALASDKGNKALQDNLKVLKSDLAATTREIKLLETQKKALDAAMSARPAASGPSAPDESARYQEHLRKMDEQERSQRAHAAIEARMNAPTPLREMPAASRAQAEIRRGYAAPTEEPGGHGGQGPGAVMMRNAELMHSGRAFASEMAAGASPLQAFLMEAPRLFQAFASSLGALIAPVAMLVGGGALVGWLASAKKEAKELRDETAMIGTNLGSTAGANAEVLEKALAAAVANADKVRDKFNSTGNAFVNGLTGGNGVQDRDVRAADDQKQRIEAKLNDARERDQGFAQRSFAGDQGVEADKIRLEYAQKRDEIYKRTTAENLQGAKDELALAVQARDLKLEELARTQKARQNEVDEETYIAGIQRYGKNVESETAKAHLLRAQADLKNGPQEGPEYRHNLNQVANAQTASDEHDKRERERNAGFDLRTRNANLRGSADDVAYQKAVNDRDAIQGKLDDPATKADERKGLEAELAEAKAQVRGLAKQSYQKGFEIDKLGIQTDQGRGPQAHKEAIEKELALIDRERKNNKEKNGDDALVDAQLSAQAHALKTEKEDIEHAEKEALTAAKAQTTEMQLQQSGHEGIAKIEAIREQYQARILEAQRLGKTELAEQYQLQQKMAMEQARMAAYFSTPGQQAAQRSQQRAIAQARERFNRDDGLQSIHRGMDGKPIDGYDPLLQERRAFGDHSAYDPKTGVPLRGPQAKNAGAQEPDRRGAATADPQQAGAKDSGDGETVSILKQIHTTLEEKLDLKIP